MADKADNAWTIVHERAGAASRKSVVFVKLTDSALASIEKFVRTKASLTSRPTIRMPEGKHRGVISIPLDSSGGRSEFTFTLSSNDEAHGPQGSFECLASNRMGCMETLGPLQEKMQVQASDDAYTRFGARMEEVKRESEKRTTQFIEQRPSARSDVRFAARRLVPASAVSPASTVIRPRPMGRVQPQHKFLPGTHPMLDRRQEPSNHPVNPELMRRPLRERIIHLLAVRPFKKPELLSRVSRDGLREKDRRNVSTILKQVSVMKDNTYHLLRHIWNDVSEDWPFYSEQERQSFRRRKPQNLTPPCSDSSTSSSGRSPCSTHPPSPPMPVPSLAAASRKRAATHDDAPSALASSPRKKRVSNYVRPPDLALTSLGASPRGRGSPSTSSMASMPCFKTSLYQTASSPSLAEQQQQLAQQDHDQDQDPVQHEEPDYVREFTRIVSREQRARYKAEFEAHYARYRQIYAILERVSKRFAELEEKINQSEPGSEGYALLKSQIVQEYVKNKQDPRYIEATKAFSYLHGKLSHVKRLVHDYDTQHGLANNQSRPPQQREA